MITVTPTPGKYTDWEDPGPFMCLAIGTSREVQTKVFIIFHLVAKQITNM